MAALATAAYDTWRLSDLELQRAAPSFTSATLSWFLANGYRPTELFFVVGADAFVEIQTWKNYPAILDSAHFAVVSRPGHPVTELPGALPSLAERMTRSKTAATGETPRIVLIDAQTADVSSTAIRTRRARGQSIAGLVHPEVDQYIERQGLYPHSPVGARGSDTSWGIAAGRLHGQD
jgi:nicotinate-nucleotide adenylyltransferase